MKLSTNAHLLALIASVPLELKLIEFSPYAGLILPTLMGGYLVKKALPKLSKKSNQIVVAGAIAFSVLMAAPQAQAAIDFSLLLDKTEKMVSSCIFNQVAGFNVATFLIFGFIRMIYIVPLALEVAEWNKKRQHNQNFSEELKTIATFIVGALFVGLVEPFFVKSC